MVDRLINTHEPMMSTDGRRILAEPCLELEELLQVLLKGETEDYLSSLNTITCACCDGRDSHEFGKGPDVGEYPCSSCKGYGFFDVSYGNGDFIHP